MWGFLRQLWYPNEDDHDVFRRDFEQWFPPDKVAAIRDSDAQDAVSYAKLEAIARELRELRDVPICRICGVKRSKVCT
jgi:hypothetical protein